METTDDNHTLVAQFSGRVVGAEDSVTRATENKPVLRSDKIARLPRTMSLRGARSTNRFRIVKVRQAERRWIHP